MALNGSTCPLSENRREQCCPIGQAADDDVLVRGVRTIADRAHPIKRGRPQCSSKVPVAASASRAFFQVQPNARCQPLGLLSSLST